MPEKTIYTALREAFPKTDRGMWQQTASKEIDNKDPFEKLIQENSDQLKFYPYYDKSDVTHLDYLKKFLLTVGEEPFFGPKKWLTVPQVTVNTETQANKISLEHLSNGADGILYVLTSNADLTKVLANVEWSYCSLFFQSRDNNFFAKNLSGFILQNHLDLQTLPGSLFWESRPEKKDVDFYLTSAKNLKSLGIIIPPSSPAKEIAQGLAEAVNRIEELKNDYPGIELFKAITFSVSIGLNFFETIAKLKALRFLWYQVTQAYGVKNYRTADLHIHASSGSWVDKNFEPHGNMIKSTTAAMASVLGGSDSLTLHAQDENNTAMNRIARNVSAILREESHLNKVSDPVAGAYTLDTMTHEIAKKAWELFQYDRKG